MNLEPITTESSNRICDHMNIDHPEAVHSYAKYYGKIKTVKSAKMISLSPESIVLKVNDQTIQIEFDHILKNCSDAHQTLVKMLKAIPPS